MRQIFRTILILLIHWSIMAQAPMTYKMPPKAILDLVDAPSTPGIVIAPNKSGMLLLDRPGYPDISELAEEELRLAGLRINPATYGPSRAGYSTDISFQYISTGEVIRAKGLPNDSRISEVSFNKSGSKVAFIHTTDSSLELWVWHISENTTQKVATELNSTIGSAFVWLDNDHIIYKKRQDKPAPKLAMSAPSGPAIQESGGTAAPVRTYQDLLRNPQDEDLFTHYTSCSLHKIHVSSNTTSDLGITGVITGVSISPNSQFVLVDILHRPYSYIVPFNRFPTVTNIYSPEGSLIENFYQAPLTENIPKGFSAVPTGRRSINWRSDQPATLYWIEALDGGDPAVTVPHRDQVYFRAIPNGSIIEGPKTQLRYSGITWGKDKMAIINEYWWASRQIITSLWDPSNPSKPLVELYNRSREDSYNDPGSFVTTLNEYGRSVLLMDNKQQLYLTGMGASTEGNRPFIDQYDPSKKTTKRLWRSDAPYFEMAITPLDIDKGQWITRRESVDSPPNYFIRDLNKKSINSLTNFPNPYEALMGIGKEIVTYTRADGLTLTGTLYSPAGYDKNRDGRLPTFMWAYPREFKSAEAASQLTKSPYEFIRLNWGSPLYWVTQGYAIFDDFSMPILGEGDEEPNETFVEQLKMSAEAAINAIVDLGVTDRNRIAVGGHSYGAFMTANLLAHTDLFAAGIARSGAYNRSLTPFGFQSEQRTYWEAFDIYHKMSPFNFADKIKTPILLIHGDADNNSGTFPMQSERFFAALKGHGATSRLVMLPHESHGYRARQSVLHTLYEMNQWMDTHVKNRIVQP
jgi:dipeptidyl aminopeptidase/acylaminoacyl peptidase